FLDRPRRDLAQVGGGSGDLTVEVALLLPQLGHQGRGERRDRLRLQRHHALGEVTHRGVLRRVALQPCTQLRPQVGTLRKRFAEARRRLYRGDESERLDRHLVALQLLEHAQNRLAVLPQVFVPHAKVEKAAEDRIAGDLQAGRHRSGRIGRQGDGVDPEALQVHLRLAEVVFRVPALFLQDRRQLVQFRSFQLGSDTYVAARYGIERSGDLFRVGTTHRQTNEVPLPVHVGDDALAQPDGHLVWVPHGELDRAVRLELSGGRHPIETDGGPDRVSHAATLHLRSVGGGKHEAFPLRIHHQAV